MPHSSIASIARPLPAVVTRTQARGVLGGITPKELDQLIASGEVRVVQRGNRQYPIYADLLRAAETLSGYAAEDAV